MNANALLYRSYVPSNRCPCGEAVAMYLKDWPMTLKFNQ